MARKKQEVQLQREIETQEEWEECMAKEGIWVVDVYQEWCGPCRALVGNFRRLKNELGDDLLNFAIAKADTIDALERYRGRCEPTFLFYAGGILVSFIHGANAPKVQRVITEQLAQEHKVLEGTAERKEVKDPVITRLQEAEMEKFEEEEAAREAEGELREAKGVTIAIIKPDAVAQGKADDIMNEMQEHGIEILAQEERELTDEEARELYSELQDEDYFEDLIRFITSGPSHLLVLTRGETGETIVKDWRDMIGPTNVEQAKDEAPNSMRAKYGEKGYMNAIHGSSSSEMAAKELAFFFPSLAVPTYLKKKENIQRTLALIRPEAFATNKDEVMNKIKEAGFTIAMAKEVQLTKEQAQEFYKEHEGHAYYDQLVDSMCSGPLLALGLARDEAISAWRDMLGPANTDEAVESAPESLRANFLGESGVNQFHGSDSEEAAKKELNFFFPMEETVAVIKPGAMGTKDDIIAKIHDAGFRIAAHKETTITRDIAEILYPNHADKEYYEDLITSMTSGPTMFMVLSREGAVDGWRQEIGDVNPEEAQKTNPESIRAKFGSDVLNNAVHGSSNSERAREEMQAVFGEEPALDEATLVVTKESAELVADVAPEYRQDDDDDAKDETTAGDTTTADTTMDQDITMRTTPNLTGDYTHDTTTADEQQGDTTQMDTTQADTTQAETTQAETTQVETTEAETTQPETTADETTTDTTEADTTAQPSTAEPTTEEPATMDQTAEQTVDQTMDETVDPTQDETTVDATVDETTGGDGAGEPAQDSQEKAASPDVTKVDESQGEKPPSPTAAEEPKADEKSPESGQKPEDTPPEGGDKKDDGAGDTTIDQTTEGETKQEQEAAPTS